MFCLFSLKIVTANAILKSKTEFWHRERIPCKHNVHDFPRQDQCRRMLKTELYPLFGGVADVLLGCVPGLREGSQVGGVHYTDGRVIEARLSQILRFSETVPRGTVHCIIIYSGETLAQLKLFITVTELSTEYAHENKRWSYNANKTNCITQIIKFICLVIRIFSHVIVLLFTSDTKLGNLKQKMVITVRNNGVWMAQRITSKTRHRGFESIPGWIVMSRRLTLGAHQP